MTSSISDWTVSWTRAGGLRWSSSSSPAQKSSSAQRSRRVRRGWAGVRRWDSPPSAPAPLVVLGSAGSVCGAPAGASLRTPGGPRDTPSGDTSTGDSGCRLAASPSARWALGGTWRPGRPAAPGGRPGSGPAHGPISGEGGGGFSPLEGPDRLWFLHQRVDPSGSAGSSTPPLRGLGGAAQPCQASGTPGQVLRTAGSEVGSEVRLAPPTGWMEHLVEQDLCPRPAASPQLSWPPGFQP